MVFPNCRCIVNAFLFSRATVIRLRNSAVLFKISHDDRKVFSWEREFEKLVDCIQRVYCE